MNLKALKQNLAILGVPHGKISEEDSTNIELFYKLVYKCTDILPTEVLCENGMRTFFDIKNMIYFRVHKGFNVIYYEFYER